MRLKVAYQSDTKLAATDARLDGHQEMPVNGWLDQAAQHCLQCHRALMETNTSPVLCSLLGLLRAPRGLAMVVKGTRAQRVLSGQSQCVDPVPMAFQGPHKVAVLHISAEFNPMGMCRPEPACVAGLPLGATLPQHQPSNLLEQVACRHISAENVCMVATQIQTVQELHPGSEPSPPLRSTR